MAHPIPSDRPADLPRGQFPLPSVQVSVKKQDRAVWVHPPKEPNESLRIILSDDANDGVTAAELLVLSLIGYINPWHPWALAKEVGYDPDMQQGKRLSPLLRAMVAELPPYPQEYTRKTWLKLFTSGMHPWFEAAGHPLPSIEIRQGRIIPELLNHAIAITEDGCYIFISPGLYDSLAVAKLLTLDFVNCVKGLSAKSVGIVDGCFTENLTDHLKAIIDRIGPYPEK